MNDYCMLALILEGKIVGWYHGGTGKFTRNRDDGTAYTDGAIPSGLSDKLRPFGLSVELVEFRWVKRMVRNQHIDPKVIVLTEEEKRLLGEGRLLWAVKSVMNRVSKDEFSLLDIKRDLELRPEYNRPVHD